MSSFIERIGIEVRLFAVLAFVFGILMVFLVPPFQVPDEEQHYLRSISLIQGELLCESGRINIRQEHLDFINQMDPGSIAFKGESTFDKNKIVDFQDSEKSSFEPVASSLCRVVPLSYIPSSLGVAVSSLFTDSELISFFVGRLANLVTAILLVSLAIAVIPVSKKIVLWVGLLPMSVFMYASYNYDALFIPLALLLVSFILFAYKKEGVVGWKQVVAIILASIALTQIKMPFILLSFLAFLLVFRNKNERKRNFVLASSIVVVNVISLATVSVLSSVDQFPEWTNPSGQIAYISSHLFTYAVIVVRTMYHNVDYYLSGMLGLFGWLDYRLPLGIYLLLFVSLGIVIQSSANRINLSRLSRILILTVVSMTALAVMTGMYVYSSRLQYPMIEGVQGRYFVPLLLPSLLVIHDILPAIKNVYVSKYSLALVSMISGVALASTVIATVLRYYVP